MLTARWWVSSWLARPRPDLVLYSAVALTGLPILAWPPHPSLLSLLSSYHNKANMKHIKRNVCYIYKAQGNQGFESGMIMQMRQK